MAHVDVPLVRSRFGQNIASRQLWYSHYWCFWPLLVCPLLNLGPRFKGSITGSVHTLALLLPELLGNPLHAWFGAKPEWMPAWVTARSLSFGPPGGFRVTVLLLSRRVLQGLLGGPSSCTSASPQKYLGERSFPADPAKRPSILLYLALVFLVLLAHDLWNALWFNGRFRHRVGTLVLAVNVTLLSGYALGCHSLRHLLADSATVSAGAPVRKRAYDCVSCL